MPRCALYLPFLSAGTDAQPGDIIYIYSFAGARRRILPARVGQAQPQVTYRHRQAGTVQDMWYISAACHWAARGAQVACGDFAARPAAGRLCSLLSWAASLHLPLPRGVKGMAYQAGHGRRPCRSAPKRKAKKHPEKMTDWTLRGLGGPGRRASRDSPHGMPANPCPAERLLDPASDCTGGAIGSAAQDGMLCCWALGRMPGEGRPWAAMLQPTASPGALAAEPRQGAWHGMAGHGRLPSLRTRLTVR